MPSRGSRSSQQKLLSRDTTSNKLFSVRASRVVLHRLFSSISPLLYPWWHLGSLRVHARWRTAIPTEPGQFIKDMAQVLSADPLVREMSSPGSVDGLPTCAYDSPGPCQVQCTSSFYAPSCCGAKAGGLGAQATPRKFYIFDNNSTTPMLPMVYDLAMEGLVEYVSLPDPPEDVKPQLYIYDTCLQTYGSHHTWMAFIDADEFIVLRSQDLHDLPALLRQYEQYGALVVNWQLFGSSGFLRKPSGGTLQSYHKCFPRDHPENLHVKTIANVAHTLGPGPDPHQFTFKEGFFAVDEQMQPVEGPRSEQVHIDQIALYHYATKSRAEYMQKIKRGSAMRNQKTIHFLDLADQEATAECTDAMLLG
ncbi:hypothetical protein WJX73_007576 [Symbiochloris irregularis]|uniref:Glycosyltransferase family 92 protein n=1 Tax=Symbiochloris irregularis TaxID=706552 RepID=A0AAW1Q1H9_9CHLO